MILIADLNPCREITRPDKAPRREKSPSRPDLIIDKTRVFSRRRGAVYICASVTPKRRKWEVVYRKLASSVVLLNLLVFTRHFFAGSS